MSPASVQPKAKADPTAGNGQPASLAARMGSWVYEGILLFGILWFATYAFDALTQSTHALMLRGLRMGFVFLVAGAYFVYFGHKGQTLPMKTWKIRLRSSKGQPASLGRCALRYTLSWAWFLPPLALLASFPQGSPGWLAAAILLPVLWLVFYMALSLLLPQRQFLHDVLAGTRLERYMPPQPHRGLV